MRLFTERRRRENDPGGHLAYSLARTG
ncbi:hypothetical protein OFC08_31795, partial [Escherichia coli]|nr:hypothetical protein [Escherichia coli]